MGQAQGRRQHYSRGDSRFLQGPNRALQDTPLHQVRGQLPHDCDRQGAKIHHARGDDQGTGPLGTYYLDLTGQELATVLISTDDTSAESFLTLLLETCRLTGPSRP